MTLDELFTLEQDEIEELLASVGDIEASWLEHDPEFIALVQQSEAIDEKVVLAYLKEEESIEFHLAKSQQQAIRTQLAAYAENALTKH